MVLNEHISEWHIYVTTSEKIWHSVQKSDSSYAYHWIALAAYSGAVRFAVTRSVPELRAQGAVLW